MTTTTTLYIAETPANLVQTIQTLHTSTVENMPRRIHDKIITPFRLLLLRKRVQIVRKYLVQNLHTRTVENFVDSQNCQDPVLRKI